MNKYREMAIFTGLSLMGAYGISYLLELMGAEHPDYSIMTVFAAAANGIFLIQTNRMLRKLRMEEGNAAWRRRITYGALVSFFFSLSMLLGYQLEKYGMTECGWKGKGLLIGRALCLSITVFPFSNLLFHAVGRISSGRKEEKRPWKSSAVFCICFAVIFLMWIPVWMAYYPIVMSYDFHRQVNEAYKGFVWFNSYQPLIHTWLIWLFLQIGGFFGSNEVGMGLFTLFQMLVVSAAMAYAANTVYKLTHRKGCVIGMTLFYGLFPFCSVSMMIGSKDAIFSALFLAFIVLLTERVIGKTAAKWYQEIPLLVTGILMMMFRYNALYAMAVFAILVLLFCRGKERIRLFILCAVMIPGGAAAKEGIQYGLGTVLRGSAVEKYSVPIQQFARVAYYHKDDMDEETYDLVAKYLAEDKWDVYMPALADASRQGVDYAGVWDPDLGQVFMDWFRVGLKYPNEYIDAFLCLTEGYWFPDDTTYCETQGWGNGDRHGAIYTNNSSASEDYEGIQHISKFPWLEEKLEKIVSDNVFYDWPVISVLFKSSTYSLALILTTVVFLYRKQKKQAFICLFPLAYFGTMLLGPAVQFRYVVPLMISVPFLISLSCCPEETSE